MDNSWLIFTGLTVIYIIILVVYFVRRSKTHEQELSKFLEMAQTQLESHKQQASVEANQKIAKAMAVVKKVQHAAQAFEKEAQTEYAQIIDDAKNERRELIAKAKAEIETLFKQADRELEEYKLERHREIERNLVKLVSAVTQKVVQMSLDEKSHQEIIFKAYEEIKEKHTRN
jgi:flagellar biosynthesis/type III secretory pathway protein FliH